MLGVVRVHRAVAEGCVLRKERVSAPQRTFTFIGDSIMTGYG